MSDTRTTNRVALDKVLLEVATSGPHYSPAVVLIRAADAIEAAGWRPPAQVIEKPGALAALPTGAVIRSRHGDVASIDHGPDGQWIGPDTRLHYIGVYMAHAEPVALVDLGSAPWTVLYARTENGDSE